MLEALDWCAVKGNVERNEQAVDLLRVELQATDERSPCLPNDLWAPAEVNQLRLGHRQEQIAQLRVHQDVGVQQDAEATHGFAYSAS